MHKLVNDSSVHSLVGELEAGDLLIDSISRSIRQIVEIVSVNASARTFLQTNGNLPLACVTQVRVVPRGLDELFSVYVSCQRHC